jgi:hypothetical protein
VAHADDAGKSFRQRRLHLAHFALALVHFDAVLAMQREPAES